MLNPHGYNIATRKSADCDLNSLMKSVKTNVTENEVQVQDFIRKETNENRRQDLQTIFEQAKALKMRFDNHRMSEFSNSQEYKSMASRLCQLIQKQRHAGRKLFVTTVSNPLLGFDCVTFFYYPTIRGVKAGQLQLMDDFIASLKGIKTEYTTDVKPNIGLVNVPKSESSRNAQGKKQKRKIKISHADFKNDVIASLASILTLHKVPIQWLDHNIDTSELPNAFTKKANILINVNLVVEMSSEPIEVADPPPFISNIKPADSLVADNDGDDDDDDWSTDGWFDKEAREIMNKSKNDSSSKKDCKRCVEEQNVNSDQLNNVMMDISYHDLNNKFSDLSADSHAPIQNDSDNPIQNDSGIILVQPSSSTPASKRNQTALPRPNDSLVSNGLPEEILNIEQIHTAPLATPRINRRSFGRSNTMQPSSMLPLLSDAEDDLPQNQSLPTTAASNDALASQKDIEGLLEKLNEKFEKLEKSLNQN